MKVNKVVFFFLLGFIFARDISFSDWINSDLKLLNPLFKADLIFHDIQTNTNIKTTLYIDNQNKKFRLEAEDRIIVSDTITWKSLLKKSDQLFIQNVPKNERLYFKLLSRDYLIKSFLKQESNKGMTSFHFYLEEISCSMIVHLNSLDVIYKIDFETNGNYYGIYDLLISNNFDPSLTFKLEEDNFIIFDLRE